MAIQKNQKEISKLIFNDPETQKKLVSKLRRTGQNEIQVQIQDQNWINLKEFEKISNENQDNYFDYFVTMILLFSDLCLQRNELT